MITKRMDIEQALEQVQLAHDLIDEGKITGRVELNFHGLEEDDVRQLAKQEGFVVETDGLSICRWWAIWQPHDLLKVNFWEI